MAGFNIKLQDVGHKVRERLATAPIKKSEIQYPSLHITGKDLKGLENFKFNDSIQINAIGRIKSISQYNDEPPEITIEIRKMGVQKKVLKRLK